MSEVAKAALETIHNHHAVLPKGIMLAGSGIHLGDQDLPEEPPEDVFESAARRTIQGNIIPGFNKDHQHFLFFRMGDVCRARRWLAAIRPSISSMEEVLTFVRAHRALRLRRGEAEPGLKATWVNIAFSYGAITTLLGAEESAAFGEPSFRQGLTARSMYLGDPTDRSHPGHRANWVVGSSGNEADILLVVASDDAGDLDDMVSALRVDAVDHDLHLLFEQRGDTLPGGLRGHEHFGFKDGISQPAVRGKVSAEPGDFITPRYLVPRFPGDQMPHLFARPGQPLVWPGQFLLGEPRQDPENFLARRPPATDFPEWARLGSYVVCRRLRQDVPAFWEFCAEGAAAAGVPVVEFASRLVGRWPSGAPLMRASTGDDPVLAGDPFAANNFLFDDRTRPSALRPIPGYPGDAHPHANADMLGVVCPHFSHIRKMNPRDSVTDLGKPADTLTRVILRRGIPYGPPVAGVKNPPPELIDQERGLMFLCYGATIEDQFEFVTRRWANSSAQPSSGGHDPVIGQRDDGGVRSRWLDFPTGSGTRRFHLLQDWVVPTGGGYFFAPPIDAIDGVLASS